MKTLIKVTLSLLALSFVIAYAGCQSHNVSPEAITSLKQLKNIVDTMAMCKENEWYVGVDTEFVEVPIDPTNPALTSIDTIITSAEESKKLGFAKSSIGGYYRSVYNLRLKDVQTYEKDMNEAMLKDLKEAENKFEDLYKQ